MAIIMGIDPGSRITGFGFIHIKNRKMYYIDSGCIRTEKDDFFERLYKINQGIYQLIEQHRPDQVAIERVFLAKNADSALKLGQARGAAIVAAVNFRLPIYEYAARHIKQATVGHGAAEKKQVQHMVRALLKLNETPQVDASDALAVAICHIHSCIHLSPTCP